MVPFLTTEQLIHYKVKHIPTGKIWESRVIHSFNSQQERMDLWKSLCDISHSIQCPWMVGGDFNNVLFPEERVGSQVSANEICDFKNCVRY